MGTRIAAGGTVAAIPAGGAIAAAAAGCLLLTAIFATLAILALIVVPLAPYVGKLHKLPLVGSPRLSVHFRLDGRTNLSTTLGSDGEQLSVLEVGVKNPEQWTDVKDAWINLLLPSGVRIYYCDRYGRPKEGGSWEEFVKHRLGRHPRADYWNDMRLEFPANLSRLFLFKLRFSEPGDYEILFKLGASTLFDGLEEGATIHVAADDPDLHARLGRLIAKGEELLAEADDTSEETLSVEIVGWLFEARIAAEEVGSDPLPKRELSEKAGTEQLKELIRRDVISLYVLRRELGEDER